MEDEIITGFQEEANVLLGEIKELLTQVEDTEEGQFPKEQICEFSIRIDRIMGAAKTLYTMYPDLQSFSCIGDLSQLCKYTGYRISESENFNFLPIGISFWWDAVDAIESLVKNVSDDKTLGKVKAIIEVLKNRLTLLQAKVDQKYSA